VDSVIDGNDEYDGAAKEMLMLDCDVVLVVDSFDAVEVFNHQQFGTAEVPTKDFRPIKCWN
jgi:hypothetical protein